jgi:hypothetical protein
MSCSGAIVPIPPVTHSPASALRLSVIIFDQYSDSAKPTVQLGVQLFEATTNQLVRLAKRAQLTCNGQDILPAIHGEPSCPRQPPGGAYQIAYTDEQGATTTLTVPVPKGVFALLSPQPGAHVPIPNGALPVRFSLPLPVSQASLEDGWARVGCGAADGPKCGEVVSPALSSLSTPVATPSVANGTRSASSTPTPATAFSCRPTPPLENWGAVVSVRADQVTFYLSGYFDSFLVGPGVIMVYMQECTMPDPAGFAAVLVTFDDSLTAPITWVPNIHCWENC